MRNITCYNTITRLLQQKQNKKQMRESNIRKKTNATKKKNTYFNNKTNLLQQQRNKKQMRESNIRRLIQQRKKYLLQQENKATATTRNKSAMRDAT
jgi:hypothetical protein